MSRNTRNADCSCAGFIVLSSDNHVPVVYTPAGRASFPKGKKEKGETDYQCALRELREETGLTADDINVIPHVEWTELSRKGTPSVHYFYAHLEGTRKAHALSAEDSEELVRAEWVPVGKLTGENWKESRKAVVAEIVDHIEIKDTDSKNK